MKNSKIRLIILGIASLALVVSLTIGGTLAWLTAKTDPLKNTFTVGQINMKLDEEILGDPDGDRTEKGNYGDFEYKIIPGTSQKKDPTVSIKTDSEPCYIYVAVKNELDRIAEYEYKSDKWEVVTKTTLGTDVTLYKYKAGVYDVSADSTAATGGYKALPSLFDEVTYADTLTYADIKDYAEKSIYVAAYAHQSTNVAPNAVDDFAIAYFDTFTWSTTVTP